MNSLYDFDYKGITFDERLAIRQLFINDDDSHLLSEQSSVVSTADGIQQ